MSRSGYLKVRGNPSILSTKASVNSVAQDIQTGLYYIKIGTANNEWVLETDTLALDGVSTDTPVSEPATARIRWNEALDRAEISSNGSAWESFGFGDAPASAEYWVGAADGTLTTEHNLGALATGIVKNTSGIPSIAVSGTDYVVPSAIAISPGEIVYGNATGDGLAHEAALSYNASTDLLTLGGGIRTGTGSEGAPIYSFTGATGTGFWYPGAEYIAWSTAGVLQGYLKSDGNIQLRKGGVEIWGNTARPTSSSFPALILFYDTDADRSELISTHDGVEWKPFAGLTGDMSWGVNGFTPLITLTASAAAVGTLQVGDGSVGRVTIDLNGGLDGWWQIAEAFPRFNISRQNMPNEGGPGIMFGTGGAAVSAGYGLNTGTGHLNIVYSNTKMAVINDTGFGIGPIAPGGLFHVQGPVVNAAYMQFYNSTTGTLLIATAGATLSASVQVSNTSAAGWLRVQTVGEGNGIEVGSLNGANTHIVTNNTVRMTFSAQHGLLTHSPAAVAAGGLVAAVTQTWGFGAHTALPSSIENPDVEYTLNRVVEFSSGPLTKQSAVIYKAPTYSFTGASTLSRASTVEVLGSPVAGTNATIIESYAIAASGTNYIYSEELSNKKALQIAGNASTTDYDKYGAIAWSGHHDGDSDYHPGGEIYVVHDDYLGAFASSALVVDGHSDLWLTTGNNPTFTPSAQINSEKTFQTNHQTSFNAFRTKSVPSTTTWDGSLFTSGLVLTGTGGPIAQLSAITIAQPNITIPTGVTVTDLTTLTIGGQPSNGGPGSVTRNYSLWIKGGPVRLTDVESAGAVSLTLTNGPTAASGNPSSWIVFYVGTQRVVVPAWSV